MDKREKVFKKFGGRCAYCGCRIDINTYHIDHVIPKSKFAKGQNNIDNYYPACPDCNLFKSDLSIEEFREKISKATEWTIQGRMIKKFFHVRPKKIKFYFEQEKL